MIDADLPWAYIIGSLLLTGSVELVYRVAHRQPLDEPSYMVVQSGLVFSTLAIIGLSGVGFAITPRMMGLGVLTGLLGYVTGWSHIYAIGRGPVSVTSALRRLSFVITGGLAIIFLGEQVTLAKAGALLLAVVATLVMASETDSEQRPHPMIFLTVATAGCMAFGHKIASMTGVSIAAFLMCQSGTAHLLAHVVCARSGGYQINARLARFAVLTGSMIACGMTLAVMSLAAADAVVVSPLLQLSFLFTAPASFLLLKEPIGRRKVVGILLGLCAVLAFGLG